MLLISTEEILDNVFNSQRIYTLVPTEVILDNSFIAHSGDI